MALVSTYITKRSIAGRLCTRKKNAEIVADIWHLLTVEEDVLHTVRIFACHQLLISNVQKGPKAQLPLLSACAHFAELGLSLR